MWYVDCAYPFDPDTFQDNDDLIRGQLGIDSVSSGAGFGFRDHQFEYDHRVDALQAQVLLRQLPLNWDYVELFTEVHLP